MVVVGLGTCELRDLTCILLHVVSLSNLGLHL